MIHIKADPHNHVYKLLLAAAFRVCDSFQLILRSDMGATYKKYQTIMNDLEPSFLMKKNQAEWASTMLFGGKKVEVFYYQTDKNALEALTKYSDSLYAWEHPKLPEDLSFFQKGKEWLVTSSHEQWCTISPNNEKERIMVTSIPGLLFEIE
ncbi:stage III sporulation protein AH [Niallia nealsonii]|uniref:Stage III sporulation protein AH n=1 Tax=Niallia nealsonii TaxID=115979 RepID=A0A2N0Z185_9BACI|nr:stage III sporulation protein AH [Niallia nealsonii]PKG23274.1 stage III sporulation protein AH [Niallia nealsonii]